MESGLNKITKQFDALNARNIKQKEEISRLKAQLAEYKSLNSRIRRVPQKKQKGEQTSNEEAQDAAQAPTPTPPQAVAA